MIIILVANCVHMIHYLICYPQCVGAIFLLGPILMYYQNKGLGTSVSSLIYLGYLRFIKLKSRNREIYYF